MEQYESPLEKAQKLKERLEAEQAEQEDAEKKNKIADLEKFRDEQGSLGEENVGEIKKVRERKKKAAAAVEKATGRRTKVKAEGKEAAAVLRSVKGKMNMKEDESLRGIFEPIIKELKSINEEVKAERAAGKAAGEEAQQRRDVELKRAAAALNAYRAEHPEAAGLGQKAEFYENAQKNRAATNEHLDKLEEKYAAYLGNKAAYDEKHFCLTDATAQKRIAELESLTKKASEEAQQEEKNLNARYDAAIKKGKGFFESKSGYEKRIDALRTELKQGIDAAWGPYRAAYQELRTLNEYIHAFQDEGRPVKEAFGGVINGELEQYLAEHADATIGSVIAEARRLNTETMQQQKLNDEEQLLKDITDVLQKNESEARSALL